MSAAPAIAYAIWFGVRCRIDLDLCRQALLAQMAAGNYHGQLPLTAIAQRAGVSRSTLHRFLVGGNLSVTGLPVGRTYVSADTARRVIVDGLGLDWDLVVQPMSTVPPTAGRVRASRP